MLDGAGADALQANGFGPPARHVTQARWFPPLLCLALAVTLCFLTLPIVAIFVDTGPGALLDGLDDPIAVDALILSLWTSTLSLLIIVVVGTPVRLPARDAELPRADALITLIELPLVLPPAVAGIGLLAALGPERAASAARSRTPASRSSSPPRASSSR